MNLQISHLCTFLTVWSIFVVEVRVLDIVVDLGVLRCAHHQAVDETPALAVEETVALMLLLVAVGASACWM